MKFSAGNAQHIGEREQQQDSFGFSDPSDKAFVRHGGFLGVVADGMGGLSNGQEASAAAVRSFLEAYQAKPAAESVIDALSRSLGEANQAVRRIVENGPANDAGTTLAAAVVLDGELYWIAAGDSRIYCLHDNELTQLTADHIYAAILNREVALGKISRSEAENHSERASLTSYLGQSQPAFTDRNLKPLLLNDGDCVMLCSDGFYRALCPDEIIDGFRGNPQHACNSLVELVLSKHRKQQDNVTVIAMKARKARLSRRTRLLLVAAACLILLATAAGFWFGGYSFLHRSSPSPTPPTAQTPPVIVSQPNPTTTGTPSVSAPPVPKQPSNAAPNKTGPAHNDHHVSTGKRPSANPTGGAAPGSTPEEHAPSGQSTTPTTSEPSQPEQVAPENNAAPKPQTPENPPRTSEPSQPEQVAPKNNAAPKPPTSGNPPGTSPTPPPAEPVPQPPASSLSNRDSREDGTWNIADAFPMQSEIPLRGDHSHGFPD